MGDDLGNTHEFIALQHDYKHFRHPLLQSRENFNVGIKELELLGTILPGDTICVTSLSIVVHRSLSSSIWRTILRESRYKVMLWVEQVVEFTISLICKKANTSQNAGNLFDDKLWKAYNGLVNLAQTYKDDYYVAAFFMECSTILTSYRLDLHSIELNSAEYISHPICIDNNNEDDIDDFVIVDVQSSSMPNCQAESRAPKNLKTTFEKYSNHLSTIDHMINSQESVYDSVYDCSSSHYNSSLSISNFSKYSKH